MPGKTPEQRRAAGAELNRRRKGMKRQEKATRPFGTASTKDVKKFAMRPQGRKR